MLLHPATQEDLPQIQAWIEADPFHVGQDKTFWLTGAPDCLFCARVEDKSGPVAYARVEDSEEAYRIHAQFGPVSKIRIAKAIVQFIDTMKSLAHTNQKKWLVIESVNPSLISFLARLGASPSNPAACDDYVIAVKGN